MSERKSTLFDNRDDAVRQRWIRDPDTDPLKASQIRFKSTGTNCIVKRQGAYLNDRWFWIFDPLNQPDLLAYAQCNRHKVHIIKDLDSRGATYSSRNFWCLIPASKSSCLEHLSEMISRTNNAGIEFSALESRNFGLSKMLGAPAQAIIKNYEETKKAFKIDDKCFEFMDVFVSDQETLLQARISSIGVGAMEPFVDIDAILRILRALQLGSRKWEKDQNL